MDPIQVHLLLNHIPILGSLFGLILLAIAVIGKNKTVEQTAYYTLVVVALVTIPVFWSGEEAEHTVEEMAGVSEHFLEEHEEISEGAVWVVYSTGALSLIVLVLGYLGKTPAVIRYITLMASIASFSAMVIVGSHGGKIRHSELIKDGTQKAMPAEGEHEHEEDEND